MIPIYAQRIREVRQSAGMTQTEFAMAIGTTKNQLSKYELGTQDTPTKIIIAVCKRFGIDANWLLGTDVNEYKPVLVINDSNVNLAFNHRIEEYLSKIRETAESIQFANDKTDE